MRRTLALCAAGAGAAVLGALLLLAVVGGRDDPTLPSRPPASERYRGEPVLSPFLEEAVRRGNVVVLHRDARTPPGTRELARAAPAALASQGLAVLFEREPTLERRLAAVAGERIATADDPARLRPFVEHHLGRAGAP